MSITVHVTGKRFDEIPTSGEPLMREIGLLAERRIRTRTESQTDVHGAPFRPLSPGYARQKLAAGLSPVPDLTVSGRMLNDMGVVEVTARTVSLGFASAGGVAPRFGRGKKGGANTFIQKSRAVGAADKAFFHNEVGAGRSQVMREFFGLNEDDEDVIEAALDHFIEQALQQ